MKYFTAPLFTNWAGFGISKITKTIKSEVEKNQLLIAQRFGNFSECIQLRMHICTPISQTHSIGVGLEHILTHRDNLALINDQRDMLFLSFHSHRQGLGNRKIIFNHMVYIHILRSQLQHRQGINSLR